jgi:hypothetical protein
MKESVAVGRGRRKNHRKGRVGRSTPTGLPVAPAFRGRLSRRGSAENDGSGSHMPASVPSAPPRGGVKSRPSARCVPGTCALRLPRRVRWRVDLLRVRSSPVHESWWLRTRAVRYFSGWNGILRSTQPYVPRDLPAAVPDRRISVRVK